MQSVNFNFQILSPEFRILGAFILAFFLNSYATPIIIRVAKLNKLFDQPNGRGSHDIATPTFGGVGLFFSIAFISLILINTCGMSTSESQTGITSFPSIIAGLIIIFFVGLKDDLISVAPWKKLIAEIIALFILTVIGDLRLTTMQGMFEIGGLNYFCSITLSVFAGIVIINAFNLVDGVDGLASSIAMLSCLVFGGYFIVTQEWEYAVLAYTVLGALIPFFYYNVFAKKNKIFMGDTGSLLLGFIITVLVFRFNEKNAFYTSEPHFIAGPAFSFTVLIIPLFDTLRVFTIRILRKGNPFVADRRHIHHLLLDFGFSHLQTTSILIMINLVFITVAYFLDFLGNSNLVYVILTLSVILSGVAIYKNRQKNILNNKLSQQVNHNLNRGNQVL